VPTSKATGLDLARLLEIVDEESRAMLWHLWWHGHADISELRPLVTAGGDFEVLHRLNDVINCRARALWGTPVVVFEQSRTDPATGRKVLFNWWLRDDVHFCQQDWHPPVVDVLNGADCVEVIAQVPTEIDCAHPEVQVKNGILKVSLKKNAQMIRRS
jgi:hypothetical protein